MSLLKAFFCRWYATHSTIPKQDGIAVYAVAMVVARGSERELGFSFFVIVEIPERRTSLKVPQEAVLGNINKHFAKIKLSGSSNVRGYNIQTPMPEDNFLEYRPQPAGEFSEICWNRHEVIILSQT